MYAVPAVQCPSHVSEINAELPRGTKLDIQVNLFVQGDSLLEDGRGALAMPACCVLSLLGKQPEAKNPQSANSSRMRLTICPIMSPERV